MLSLHGRRHPAEGSRHFLLLSNRLGDNTTRRYDTKSYTTILSYNAQNTYANYNNNIIIHISPNLSDNYTVRVFEILPNTVLLSLQRHYTVFAHSYYNNIMYIYLIMLSAVNRLCTEHLERVK